MLRRSLRALEKHVFQPSGIPQGLVFAIALAPPVAAGLLIFGAPAAIALGCAAAAGLLGALAGRMLGLPLSPAPLLAAVVAVALAGPGAPTWLLAVLAAAGAGGAVARDRWWPAARVHAGLVAFAAVYAATRGATAVYLNPSGGHPLAEPVRLAAEFYGGAPAFDPVRLYVGNVPGPLFATSLLAVVLGAAWLWYAGRLAPAVPVAFGAGALLPALVLHWDLRTVFESGPAWFAAALLLGDRRHLPASSAAKLVLALAAGLAGIGARTFGAGIEAVFLAAAALEVVVAIVEAAGSRLGSGAGRPAPRGRFSFRRRPA